MKRRTTFNLRFWIYKSRAKSGNVPLYARITVNGQRAEAGIKRSAPVNLWDAENGKMRGNCEESREINSYLSLIQGSVFEAYQGLIIEKVTAKAIRDRFLGIEENPDSRMLLETIDYHNERNRDVLEWGTLKNYFTTRRYMQKFLKQKIKVADIRY